jgi:tetratricopeptide (TPR) repeat protein
MTTLVALLPAALVLTAGPLAADVTEGTAGRPGRGRSSRTAIRSPAAAVAMLAAALALALACLFTEYQPVLRSRAALAEALYHLQRGDPNQAQAAAEQAAAADRWSPEPWRMLAELHLGRWLASGDSAHRQAFEAAAQRFTSLHPRHHQAWQSRGNWYLSAWRKSKQDSDLRSAIEAYRQAVVCYPNHAAHHAQLAWALHLAGEDRLAAEEAARAKALDDRMPHREQKLSRQRVFDPELTAAGSTASATNSAEQIVERLRTTAKENTP